MRDMGAAYLDELRLGSNDTVVEPSHDNGLRTLLQRLATLDAGLDFEETGDEHSAS